MIQTYAHQKELYEARLNIKTCEQLFANLIHPKSSLERSSNTLLDRGKNLGPTERRPR